MDRRNGRRAVCAALIALGVVAAPAQAAPGVSVSSLSSLQAGTTAGTLHGTVVNDTGKAKRAAVAVRIFRRGTSAAVVGRTSVKVAAHGKRRLPRERRAAGFAQAGQLLPRRVYGLRRRRRLAGLRHRAGRGADQGRHPGPAAPRAPTRARRAGRRVLRRRLHAAAGRLAPVPGDGQHGLQERPHRHPPGLRRADEPVPRRHVRRPAAARDAVPDVVQPRLRAHERRHQHHDPGPEPGGPGDHDQRRPGDVHVQAADLPRQPERPRRSRTRSRTPRRTPTRSARPTRTRRPARRSAPAPRCRARSAPRPSS